MMRSTIGLTLSRRSDASKPGEVECTFQKKVENAMEANFSAAIVFIYKDDSLIPMGETGDIDIDDHVL